MHPADAELVQACLRGDGGAWRTLVERYGRLVLLVVQRTAHAHGVNVRPEEAEDLAAEVFAALVRDDATKLRAYDARYALSTWLGTIARSVAVDRLRSRRPSGGPVPEGTADPESADPSQVLSREETARAVKEVLESLGPRERLVVELFYYSGKKYREIAEILGVPLNTVCSTLSRALEKLRDRLGGRDVT
jgi:RNA polymerase sigma-70 factor (ECF subfamily)